MARCVPRLVESPMALRNRRVCKKTHAVSSKCPMLVCARATVFSLLHSSHIHLFAFAATAPKWRTPAGYFTLQRKRAIRDIISDLASERHCMRHAMTVATNVMRTLAISCMRDTHLPQWCATM